MNNSMKSYQYSDNEEEQQQQQHFVDVIHGCDEHTPVISVVGEAPPKGNWMKTTGLIAFTACVFVAFLAKSSSNSHAFPVAAMQLVDIEGSSKASSAAVATPCTFEECYATNCNWKVAPYTCLFMNGGPHGGCSPTPWFVPETCTTQCDLSKCGDLKIPSNVQSCDDIPCDPTWCKTTGERLCGSTAPYQCTEGSSAFGCTADEFLWTFKSAPSTCSTCCNAAKCA